MPFFEAASTARGRRVLCDEDRVLAHRCLFTVVWGISRRQSFFDELSAVFENHVEALRIQVVSLVGSEVKPAAKGGSAQALENLVEIIH